MYSQTRPASDFDVENVPEDQEAGYIEMVRGVSYPPLWTLILNKPFRNYRYS